MEYTQYINSMQQYGRVPAEMALGAYEIVATKEYCRVCTSFTLISEGLVGVFINVRGAFTEMYTQICMGLRKCVYR